MPSKPLNIIVETDETKRTFSLPGELLDKVISFLTLCETAPNRDATFQTISGDSHGAVCTAAVDLLRLMTTEMQIEIPAYYAIVLAVFARAAGLELPQWWIDNVWNDGPADSDR